MDFSFDKIADALRIIFSQDAIVESDEIAPGIIVDYSGTKDIIGLEILNFSFRNLNLNQLITLSTDLPLILTACKSPP